MFELQVNSMTCGGCARRVTAAVQSVDKAADVQIDLPAKLIRVSSQADAQSIAAAVTAAGYPAKVTSDA
jgi:copper chaperone